MTPSFSIIADHRRKLLRIEVGGFFMPSDVGRFVAMCDEAVAQLGSLPHGHVTLVDMRQVHIQSQESVAAFERVLAKPRYRARRLGFVVERSLSRMQVQRVAASRDARFFLTVAEAESWLMEPPEAAATSPIAARG